MAIQIARFNPEQATTAHEGTILADHVLPQGMKAPFTHLYGCLSNGHTMAGHAHAADEIYLVLSGSGYVTVGGKNHAVKAGDTVAIPHDVWHTMMCTDQDEAPFLWAAFWWERVKGSEFHPEEICIQRFKREKAVPAHQDSILTAPVVPTGLATPFSHAYGYLSAGKTMAAHAHAQSEVYLVFQGEGEIRVGSENGRIHSGDVVEIPAGQTHAIGAAKDQDLLWAAFWWPEIK